MIDKPAGLTSHDVVQAVRRRLRTRRVGHAGTLDPFATGLLTVLVGSATRLSRYLTSLPKVYHGTLRLGAVTDTDDLTGRVQWEAPGADAIPDDEVRRAMQGLTGDLEQLPPVYSAKKVGGVAAHRRARRGETVEVAPTRVTVDRFDLTARHGPDVSFEASVGSGTYIRSLARDLGAALGCGAHLRALRRVRVGPHDVADACPPDAIDEEHLLPARRAVAHLPVLELDAAARDAVGHGRAVARPDTVPAEGPVALLHADALCAVGDADAALIHPRVVLPA